MNSDVKAVISFIAGALVGGFGTYMYLKKQYDKKMQKELKFEMDKWTNNKILEKDRDPEAEDFEELLASGKLKPGEKIDDYLARTRPNYVKDYKDVIDGSGYSEYERQCIREATEEDEDSDYEEDDDYIGEEDPHGDGGPDNIEKRRRYRKVDNNFMDKEVRPYIFDPDDCYFPDDCDSYEHELVFYNPETHECITELGRVIDDVDAELGFENLKELERLIENCEDLYNNSPVINIRNERRSMEYEVSYDNRNF